MDLHTFYMQVLVIFWNVSVPNSCYNISIVYKFLKLYLSVQSTYNIFFLPLTQTQNIQYAFINI